MGLLPLNITVKVGFYCCRRSKWIFLTRLFLIVSPVTENHISWTNETTVCLLHKLILYISLTHINFNKPIGPHLLITKPKRDCSLCCLLPPWWFMANYKLPMKTLYCAPLLPQSPLSRNLLLYLQHYAFALWLSETKQVNRRKNGCSYSIIQKYTFTRWTGQ